MDRIIVAAVIVAGFVALGFAGPDGPAADEAGMRERVSTSVEAGASSGAPVTAVTADAAERWALSGSR
ncbi:hypothetical protein ACFVTX_15595 [Agromyces sp. NPDC058136]|uniref:hypothetical protein n=1 Tax=Agromyces sp. NPDC058136 TaxID=3346354 RepID=UPI0036D89156